MPYAQTGIWPTKFQVAQTLGVSQDEVVQYGFKALPPSDVDPDDWSTKKRRMAYAEKQANMTEAEREAQRSKRRLKWRAQQKKKNGRTLADRHTGSLAFIAEQIALDAKLPSKETIRQWEKRGPEYLREKVVAKVGTDRAEEILSSFYAAKKLPEDGSTVKKKLRANHRPPTSMAVGRGRFNAPPTIPVGTVASDPMTSELNNSKNTPAIHLAASMSSPVDRVVRIAAEAFSLAASGTLKRKA